MQTSDHPFSTYQIFTKKLTTRAPPPPPPPSLDTQRGKNASTASAANGLSNTFLDFNSVPK